MTNRLSNSNSTAKVKVCRNGTANFCIVLVKKRENNDYFLQILEQIRHQLGLVNPVRTLYSWTGRKIKNIGRLTSLSEPCWAALGGENFISSGASEWFTAKRRLISEDIKIAVQEEDEGKEEDLREESKILKERIAKIEAKSEREEMLGSDHKMRSIKEVSSSDRILGGMKIRLRLHENGDEKNFTRVVINLDDLKKISEISESSSKSTQDPLWCLKMRLSEILSTGRAKQTKVKRLFLMDGSEVTDIDGIEHDLELWWSDGGSFKQFTTLNIGLKLELVKIYKTEEEDFKFLSEGEKQKWDFWVPSILSEPDSHNTDKGTFPFFLYIYLI